MVGITAMTVRVYPVRGVSRLGVSSSVEEDEPPSCANQCTWSKEGDSKDDLEGVACVGKLTGGVLSSLLVSFRGE